MTEMKYGFAIVPNEACFQPQHMSRVSAYIDKRVYVTAPINIYYGCNVAILKSMGAMFEQNTLFGPKHVCFLAGT